MSNVVWVNGYQINLGQVLNIGEVEKSNHGYFFRIEFTYHKGKKRPQIISPAWMPLFFKSPVEAHAVNTLLVDKLNELTANST